MEEGNPRYPTTVSNSMSLMEDKQISDQGIVDLTTEQECLTGETRSRSIPKSPVARERKSHPEVIDLTLDDKSVAKKSPIVVDLISPTFSESSSHPASINLTLNQKHNAENLLSASTSTSPGPQEGTPDSETVGLAAVQDRGVQTPQSLFEILVEGDQAIERKVSSKIRYRAAKYVRVRGTRRLQPAQWIFTYSPENACQWTRVQRPYHTSEYQAIMSQKEAQEVTELVRKLLERVPCLDAFEGILERRLIHDLAIYHVAPHTQSSTWLAAPAISVAEAEDGAKIIQFETQVAVFGKSETGDEARKYIIVVELSPGAMQDLESREIRVPPGPPCFTAASSTLDTTSASFSPEAQQKVVNVILSVMQRMHGRVFRPGRAYIYFSQQFDQMTGRLARVQPFR